MLTKAVKQRLQKRIAGRANRKLSRQQRDEIVKRYADNESATALAEEYGVSLYTVYRWIKIAAQDS